MSVHAQRPSVKSQQPYSQGNPRPTPKAARDPNTNYTFTKVPDAIMARDDLNLYECVSFAVILRHCRDGTSTCTANNATMAREAKIPPRTFQRATQKLIKVGLISSEGETSARVITVTPDWNGGVGDSRQCGVSGDQRLAPAGRETRAKRDVVSRQICNQLAPQWRTEESIKRREKENSEERVGSSSTPEDQRREDAITALANLIAVTGGMNGNTVWEPFISERIPEGYSPRQIAEAVTDAIAASRRSAYHVEPTRLALETLREISPPKAADSGDASKQSDPEPSEEGKAAVERWQKRQAEKREASERHRNQTIPPKLVTLEDLPEEEQQRHRENVAKMKRDLAALRARHAAQQASPA